MFALIFLILSLISCQRITGPADVMDHIISKAESFVGTDHESKVFSVLSTDFKNKGITILEKRSDHVLDHPSTIYQEAALAKRDLIRICKNYKSNLVKRAFGIRAVMTDMAGLLTGAVLLSSMFAIIRFFFTRLNSTSS